MITGLWFLLCGKLAAVIERVADDRDVVALVPAGICFSHTTRPDSRSSAITLPSNVVVKTRSFETVAAPYAGWGRSRCHFTEPSSTFERHHLARALGDL